MFSRDTFGLIRPNDHSSPISLPNWLSTPPLHLPQLAFPMVPFSSPTTKADQLGMLYTQSKIFPDITQGLSRNPGIKNEENAVESTSPTTGSSTSDVSKQAASTVDNRPSLELSADALVTMESSNTPPSMADWKKVSPNKASSPPWSPGNSGTRNRTPDLNEVEGRLDSSEMGIFTEFERPSTDGIFVCHLCEYTGEKQQDFQTHLRSHYDYRCPKCDYTSRTEGRLRRHMEGFHSAVPPENFSGKSAKPTNRMKVQRCKQCDYVAQSKVDYWQHQRTHIKAERLLQCDKCPFVTEYRHHLDYHIRNHIGSKPYKCTKCNYECVNKSMLNSHMKSHTNVYQYRCADCSYASKYCHSLKVHLAKLKHSQALILNVDGSLPENASSLSIKSNNNEVSLARQSTAALPTSFLPLFPSLPTASQDISMESSQVNIELMSAFIISMQKQAFNQAFPPPSIASTYPPFLNLPLSHGEVSSTATYNESVLDLSTRKPSSGVNVEDSETTAAVQFECPYCEIIFKNETHFEMHNQFHDSKEPFHCKRCGISYKNSVEFFNHINENEHGGDNVKR